MAEQRIGNEFEVIHRGKKNDRGSDQQGFFHFQRQQIHHQRWAAGVCDGARESRQAAPERGLCFGFDTGLLSRGETEPMIQCESHRDAADEKANRLFIQLTEHEATERHAQHGAEDHDLDACAIPDAAIRPQADQIH